MTPQQVAQVQASFAKVAPIAEQAAALFYGRLFETAPETRALFKGDMQVQGRKLMAAIAAVVDSLGEIEAIVPTVQELAKRHVAYGVRPEHYSVVGAALLWTLEQGLADGFTPELCAAWTAAYGTLSEAMIAAAYPEP
jgi:hemoglobin-like flavoprotein